MDAELDLHKSVCMYVCMYVCTMRREYILFQHTRKEVVMK